MVTATNDLLIAQQNVEALRQVIMREMLPTAGTMQPELLFTQYEQAVLRALALRVSA